MLEETKLVGLQAGRKKAGKSQLDCQNDFKGSSFCGDGKTGDLKWETWITKDTGTGFVKCKDCVCELYKSFHLREVWQHRNCISLTRADIKGYTLPKRNLPHNITQLFHFWYLNSALIFPCTAKSRPSFHIAMLFSCDVMSAHSSFPLHRHMKLERAQQRSQST